jgi:membrane protein implicated in regulation of membrane protease activity
MSAMGKTVFVTRLVLAVISTGLVETGFWIVWRYVLPGLGISLHQGVLFTVMAVWAAFSVWLFIFTTHALKRNNQAAASSLVGARGKVTGPLTPEGLVRVRGETWSALSLDGNIAAGEEIVVAEEKGLKLTVRRSKAPKR